jgi:Na+/H+ antiporter NhaA
MKFDFKKSILRLSYTWFFTFLTMSVVLLTVQFILAPLFAFMFHGISFSLPTTKMLIKLLGFDIFCTFSVGTILWISSEIQLWKEARRTNQP